MPSDPAKDAAVEVELQARRRVEDDHVTTGDAEGGEILGELA
jgi:hypothetical protein